MCFPAGLLGAFPESSFQTLAHMSGTQLLVSVSQIAYLGSLAFKEFTLQKVNSLCFFPATEMDSRVKTVAQDSTKQTTDF